MCRHVICLLVTLLSATVAAAQSISPDEAEKLKTSWTLERIEDPPPRQIKFVTSETPLPVRLKVADAAMLDQKYVATVRLEAKPCDWDALPEELWLIAFWPKDNDYFSFFFDEGRARPSARDKGPKKLAGVFELMLQQIPADRRPSEGQMKFFLSNQLEDGYLQTHQTSNWRGSGKPLDSSKPPTGVREFRILATSAEQAEERVGTLLVLLDQGLRRPVQRSTWNYRAELLADFPDRFTKKMAALKEEIAVLKKQTAESLELTADLLPGLKLQRAEADAAFADATARAEECEQLLAKGTLNVAGQQQIRSLQLAVQVELRGLTARRDVMHRNLDKVTAAIKARDRLAKAEHELSQAPEVAEWTLRQAITETNNLDACGLELVDGSVTIQPLKWESGKN